MAYYSYVAYFMMLSTLFLALQYGIEACLFKRDLQKQFDLDDKVILEAKSCIIKSSKSIPVRYYVNQCYKRRQLSLDDQTQCLFSPLLLRLSAIKSIAPGLGLCFTVLSIIASFQVFSDSGDIKAMFHAVSIGLGTTAIGAITMVISKLTMDRLVIPTSLETFYKFNAQVTQLQTSHPLKQASIKGALK